MSDDKDPMDRDKALKLLKLPTKTPSMDEIERAYLAQKAVWKMRHDFAVTLEERKRAEDALAMLQDAKAFLTVSTPTQHPRTASPAPRRRPQTRAGRFFARVWTVLVFVWRWLSVAARGIRVVAKFLWPYLKMFGKKTGSLSHRFCQRVIELARTRPRVVMASGATLAGTCAACFMITSSSMPWHYANVLIRTWPASEVSVDGRKAGSAPARVPIRIPKGAHKLFFAPVDSTIQTQEITIILQKDGNIELLVDLQAHTYNAIDRPKGKEKEQYEHHKIDYRNIRVMPPGTGLQANSRKWMAKLYRSCPGSAI